MHSILIQELSLRIDTYSILAGSLSGARVSPFPVTVGLDSIELLRCTIELSLDIDTGSSDLWVKVPVMTTERTNVEVNLTYGVGSAAGKLVFGPTCIGVYCVPEQSMWFLVHTSPTRDLRLL